MANRKENLTHSVHQERLFPRCVLHNYSRDVSPMFTSFLDMSISFFKIDLPEYPNIHCLFSFDQANLTTNHRQAKTNKKKQETTSCKKPCNVAKENNIIKDIIKDNITQHRKHITSNSVKPPATTNEEQYTKQ